MAFYAVKSQFKDFFELFFKVIHVPVGQAYARVSQHSAPACGMDCVGVEFFPGAEPGELADAGAVAVVKNVAELREFILTH